MLRGLNQNAPKEAEKLSFREVVVQTGMFGDPIQNATEGGCGLGGVSPHHLDMLLSIFSCLEGRFSPDSRPLYAIVPGLAHRGYNTELWEFMAFTCGNKQDSACLTTGLAYGSTFETCSF